MAATKNKRSGRRQRLGRDQMSTQPRGKLPFRPISEFYLSRFKSKVYKIPVAVAETCPNREGLRGMQTCSFCDVWGSAAHEDALPLPLNEQIEKYRAVIKKKYKAEQFLVYFQAYTTTFKRVKSLESAFAQAYEWPDVCGLVVGTRPDCLSASVLDLWQRYHEKKFVAVELGVQSFDDRQLLFLRRGHTGGDSLKAIEKISSQTQVDLGVHLIFGLPGETESQVRKTAEICNQLPITNVKLHNLHVLKNTELEKWYRQGLFEPFDFGKYARHVQIFLEHLSPRLFIHRLAAYAPRWDELVAPSWTADKMRTHQGIVDFLNSQQSFQARHFQATHETYEGHF
jgi:uncharacterized protein